MRLSEKAKAVLYPTATLLAVLVLWEATVRLFNIDEFLLPAPSSVAAELLENFSVVFAPNIWPTVQGVLLAFLLSIVVGISLGVLIALSRTAEQCVYPILVISQAVPKVAIAPLLIVWLGFGAAPKIILATLIAFFPIVLSTVAGLRSAPIELAYLGRTMGASWLQLFAKILFPHAMPMIFTGLKLGVTFAVIGVVVGEFVGANSGLGYLILAASSQLNTPVLFGALVLLALLGIVAFYAVVIVERLMNPAGARQKNLVVGM